MKLLAVKNKTHCLFSVGHYDFNTFENLMVDGGQPGCLNYAGYNRFCGETVWIDLPNVDFADLYNDYKFSQHNDTRKYGLHKLEEVRILTEDEYPNTNLFEWEVDNAVWGTKGKDGNQPLTYILLKNADTDHLQNILSYKVTSDKQSKQDRYVKIIEHILKERSPDRKMKMQNGSL
jgi:hypothetical protein